MNPGRWKQIEDLYTEALTLDTDARGPFLDAACGADPALRAEIDSLLTAHVAAGNFLSRPAVDVAAQKAPDVLASLSALGHETTGMSARQTIGAWRLIEEIGRGGMGTVWLAERADAQFQSRVAIKIIRDGLDSEDALRRFLHERQILASLNHPNITRLIDGGIAADGRPYFVMEYIAGVPLDEYCNRNRLPVRDRVRLFLDVCAAVQHAHRNLVIHRDLKPGNILVTSEGVVKLLDFGIARILNHDLIGGTIHHTAPAQRLMTPEYASPEQVRGGDITTATDVYALGIVLYELLCGHRPFQFDRARPGDMLQAICEKDPPRPSTLLARRVTTMADETGAAKNDTGSSAAQISADRGVTLPRLRRLLANDLDNIVLMALRKEPERRYGSAQQMADDLTRYLDGLPVMARQESLMYIAGKYVRRHRLGVAAIAVMLLLLVSGILLTTWQARRANAARTLAEHRLDEMRQMARTMMVDLHNEIQPLPGSTAAREFLAKSWLEYLDRLQKETSNNQSLDKEIAEARHLLGVARMETGNFDSALTNLRQALATRQQLLRAAPGNTELQSIVAFSHHRLGRALQDTGSSGEAMEQFQRELEIRERLLARDPASADQQRFYARALYQKGRALLRQNKTREAQAHIQRAWEIHNETLARRPDDATTRHDLALATRELGQASLRLGKTREAIASCRRALALMEATTAANPRLADWQLDMSETLMELGTASAINHDRAAATQCYTRALRIAESLMNNDRVNNRYKSSVDAARVLLRNLTDGAVFAVPGTLSKRDQE
ncbi:MAG: protein kinase domain-containing protein [Blastocatellia bacterium]